VVFLVIVGVAFLVVGVPTFGVAEANMSSLLLSVAWLEGVSFLAGSAFLAGTSSFLAGVPLLVGSSFLGSVLIGPDPKISSSNKGFALEGTDASAALGVVFFASTSFSVPKKPSSTNDLVVVTVAGFSVADGLLGAGSLVVCFVVVFAGSSSDSSKNDLAFVVVVDCAGLSGVLVEALSFVVVVVLVGSGFFLERISSSESLSNMLLFACGCVGFGVRTVSSSSSLPNKLDFFSTGFFSVGFAGC